MEINKIQKEADGKSGLELVAWAIDRFGTDKIALATSFGAEDQVLIDMLLKVNKNAQVFTLDTGRLPQETYDILDETRKWGGINIDVIFPDTNAVEKLVREHGANSFYESVENRKACCKVRKVEPLTRRLKPLLAWICGLRKEQSVTRSSVNTVQWDEAFSLVKINPLANWTEQQVWDYIKENNIPFNKLHEKGYPSIGCAPCTRAIEPGQDIRSGRWWWESPEHKECGLHIVDGKITPGRKI